MPDRQFSKHVARENAVTPLGRARRLAVIACLALLLLAPAAAKASDWMPRIEEEATSSPAQRQPARQAPEPDPLAPLVEKPDHAPQKAAGPSSGQAMRMPVLVAYSALNRDLAALAGKKPLALKTGCDTLALKSPKIGPGGGPGLVTLKCPADFTTGVVREGSCRTLKKWSGTMAAAYRVGYGQPGGRLVFTPESLALRDAQGRGAPPEIVRGARKFTGLVSQRILGRLSLKKHVKPPGGMASGLFEDAGGWLSDLDRPEGWRVLGVEAVRAGLEVSLETQAKAAVQQADRPLSDKELLVCGAAGNPGTTTWWACAGRWARPN